ncbi:PGAP1-domain-containing protein, partial [Nadsonia fulvescens var. elongata DSM 6958]
LVSICSIIILLIVYGSFTSSFIDFNGCRMAYMYPSYVKLHHFDSSHTRASLASKYGLYLYKEGNLQTSLIPDGGIPVLYIPGNAGSYRQGRSIGAELANVFDQIKADGRDASNYGDGKAFDMFTADFDEDLTAFHGKTLLDQAEYINDAIDFILSLYSPDTHPATKDVPLPKSVILIGHSMGGIVARTLVTLPDYTEGSVNTILTLSTPHVVPPATFDSDITKIYHLINQRWRDMFTKTKNSNDKISDITLISIAGGNTDIMVPSDYCAIDALVPATNGLTTFTTSIPFVWTSIDHEAIVWCDQMRKVLAKALFEVIDPRVSGKTKSVQERMQVFRKHFLAKPEQ